MASTKMENIKLDLILEEEMNNAMLDTEIDMMMLEMMD